MACSRLAGIKPAIVSKTPFSFILILFLFLFLFFLSDPSFFFPQYQQDILQAAVAGVWACCGSCKRTGQSRDFGWLGRGSLCASSITEAGDHAGEGRGQPCRWESTLQRRDELAWRSWGLSADVDGCDTHTSHTTSIRAGTGTGTGRTDHQLRQTARISSQ